MTVRELREMLEEFDDALPVLMSSDPEGNHFYAAHEVEPAVDVEVWCDVVPRAAVIWPA